MVPAGDAYLVRIQGNTVSAFERPIGSIAPLDINGSFLLPGGWTPLTPADLLLAGFQGSVGFGPSPDSGTPHPMAEFQLTISRPGHSGLYDPAPAFWGASEKSSGGADPPISSAIFTLDPDFGPSIVVPVLGPNGAPIQKSSATIPEPGAWILFVSGALALFGVRRFKRSTA